jgi:hypothetical protein
MLASRKQLTCQLSSRRVLFDGPLANTYGVIYQVKEVIGQETRLKEPSPVYQNPAKSICGVEIVFWLRPATQNRRFSMTSTPIFLTACAGEPVTLQLSTGCVFLTTLHNPATINCPVRRSVHLENLYLMPRASAGYSNLKLH